MAVAAARPGRIMADDADPAPNPARPALVALPWFTRRVPR
jgi:hypothetical protein